MIRLNDIEYRYEESIALKPLTLDIKSGEHIVILGSNGSGKSTLLRILAGLYYPTSGKYILDNREINKSSIDKEFRRDVAIVFQNPESMLFNPTVYDEIAFGLREFEVDNIDTKVKDIANRFEIEHLLHRSPLLLSGGEKQKVVIASMLVLNPKLLLLDEPTASMDPKTTGWFIDTLIELPQTIVTATHDLSLAYEISSRVIVLSQEHNIIYDGDIEELLKDLDILIKANLIHKHKHKHKGFHHSHYHMHYK